MRYYHLIDQNTRAPIVIAGTGGPKARVDVVLVVIGWNAAAVVCEGSIRRSHGLVGIEILEWQIGRPVDQIRFDGAGRLENVLGVGQHFRMNISPEIRQMGDDHNQFIAD